MRKARLVRDRFRRALAEPFCFTPFLIQSLGEAAFGFKSLCLGRKLAVEQITAQVQQRKSGIGYQHRGRHGPAWTFTDGHGRLTFVSSFRVSPYLSLFVCVLLPFLLVRVFLPFLLFFHPGANILKRRTAIHLEAQKRRMVRLPQRQPTLPQKILIIQAQLFKTRPRHVRKLQLRLFRGPARLAALGDVLHPAPRRLNHLVMSPAAFLDIAVAETNRDVVHQLRNLEALQLAVTAVFGN